MIGIFFELFRYTITLLYGVFISAAFLNIRMSRQNIILLCAFSLADLTLQGILLYFTQNVSFITMIYPVIVHLPLLLLFIMLYRKNLFSSVIAITSTYLCCCIAVWISVIAATSGLSSLFVDIIYTLALIGTGILVLLFIKESFASILAKPARELISFGMVPLFYYIFDYISTVYTELLYDYNQIAVEFTPFLLCICYLVFCTVYFKEYEEKQAAENRNRLIIMRQEQSEKEIAMIRRSENTISLLRHDMRHFLNNISWYIENGETEKAQEYIHEIIESADRTARKKYCSNETVNMILSSYEDTITENNIDFQYELRIPSELPVSDVDLTSILSNGMENAIHAVCMPDCKNRIIELRMTHTSGKLFISLENTYAVRPQIVDGMPVSREKNHGFGTQSIQYTTEKAKGNCHFSLSGDRFILQIVL